MLLIVVALSNAKTDVKNMKIAVDELEDEKRLQAEGKFYYTVDRLENKKILQVLR